MQSRPYEAPVLLKCYVHEPAAKNLIKTHFECITRLFTLSFTLNSKLVYYWSHTRTEVVPVIWCFNNHSILSSDCIIENILLLFLCSKLIEYNHANGHEKQNLVLFALLLFCYIKIISEITHEENLNFSNRFLITRYKIYSVESVTHNVVISVVPYFWPKVFIRIYLYLLNYLSQSGGYLSLTSDILNGSNISSDMEVDEKRLTQESITVQICEEDHVSFNCQMGKNEEGFSAVIKNVQNMKETDCVQANNSFSCTNFKDNNDVKLNNSDEMVVNGDLMNCHNSNDTSDLKKLNSISDAPCTLIDNTLTESNIKKEEVHNHSEVNGTDIFNSCSQKENESSVEDGPNNKIIKTEKDAGICDVKPVDHNLEKEKIKFKDHTGNSNLTSHTSTKKSDEQSLSHHSSSSSSSSSKSKYKDYKGSSHRSSSSSKSSSDRSKSNEGSKSKHESDKRKSRSCHHRSDEKCHCKSHHHSRHHSKKSKKFQSVKTQCTADEIAHELRGNKPEISNPYFTRVPWVPHPQLANLKYGRYYRIEVDRNGGASIVHLYMDEINHLSESQMKECAVEFIKLSYSEDENECAYHVMGIVHGAAAYLPDLVDYMADHYPTLTVKTGSLASRDNHTTTMSQYRDEVYKTYSNGTFRYAPLDQLSICGVLGEEVGAYFPDFVARLEQSPFMKPVMPWSSLSVVETDNPRESNDGPIFWVRPGEQMLPANEALKESARPKKRRNNELDNLAYIAGSRSSEARESLFMDRTKAHADQVGVDYGLSNTAPTAAVGVLKSVNCGHPEHGNRATKDVVAFHAQDYNELLEILMLDLYEPPQTQCTKWLEVSKLNTLRREGIRYAHVQLHDNDVYYLPRKIIHQFQTISSVASVAWHIRYKDYFSIMGAPNLHTPTGINKGQVFYEKKNVAVYYPPVCEQDLLASVTNPGSPLAKTPKKCEKLKEYSPFKHSPRKNHKIHSPRTSSKKEKGSDSVPQTPNKKEPGSVVSNEEDKKSSSARKDHASESRDASDSSSRRDRESSSSKKSDKYDGSNHHQSSDHSSAKKEKKESHESGYRKEVKNLESDFDSKKSKSSKSGRSPSKSKSGHDGRRSEDGKSESSSRHKRHDEYRSKSHSKHEKSSSSHRKSESSSQLSNGSATEKGEERYEKNLKRKNSEGQDSLPSKRVKEEKVVENGGVVESSVSEEKAASESDACGANSNSNVSDSRESDSNRNGSSQSNHTSSAGVTSPDPVNADHPTVVKCEPMDGNDVNECEQTDVLNVKANAGINDLKQSASSRVSSVPVSADPPSACSSPLFNPPLPPNSPVLDGLGPRSSSMEGGSATPVHRGDSSPATNAVNSEEISPAVPMHDPTREKNSDALHSRKVKKKIVKKIPREENENYDLLGDIMSQMDKKK